MQYKMNIYTAAHRHLDWTVPMPSKGEHYNIMACLLFGAIIATMIYGILIANGILTS